MMKVTYVIFFRYSDKIK